MDMFHKALLAICNFFEMHWTGPVKGFSTAVNQTQLFPRVM